MKVLTIMIIALIRFSSPAFAQGFDWEWQARAPRTMPTTFAGLEVSSGYMSHSTDVTYTENFIPCCEIESGTGIPLRISLIAENWIQAKTAVHAGLGIQMSGGSFTAPGDTLPRADGNVNEQPLITEYSYEASLTYATLEAGIRQRLFDSYLSIGLTVRGQILLSAGERLVEIAVSPDDYYFTSNPPSKEFEHSSKTVTAFSSFVLEPALSIQYDIALGMGTYIAPSFTLSVPVTSVSSDATWRYVWAGFGVSLMRGL